MAASKALISIVVPVLGEGPGLASLPDRVREAAGGEPHELIVVDGDPQGSSIRRMDHASALLLALGSDQIPSRARQMNLGAARSSGDVLLFLHADTDLPPGALGPVRGCLANGLAVGGAFSLGFDDSSPALSLVAATARVRTRLTRVPFGDQALFLTVQAFVELGGFPDIPVMEDVALFRAIRSRGWEIVILPERVSTSARRYREDGIPRRVLGNWRLQLLYALGADPARLSRGYRPPSQGREEEQ